MYGSIVPQNIQPTTQNIPIVNTGQYKVWEVEPIVNVHIC
jgi:hypothetical protein